MKFYPPTHPSPGIPFMIAAGLTFGEVARISDIPTPSIGMPTTMGIFEGLGLIDISFGIPRIVSSDLSRLIEQRIFGSRADIPLGIPISTEVLQRTGAGISQVGGPTVAQGATEILETVTGAEESGVFDDIFGGVGDVFGNILEGINSAVEGVQSVVGDVASAAEQVGQVGVAFEEAIGGIRGQVRSLPALIRGGPRGGTRGQDIATGAVLGEAAETAVEFVEDVIDYFTGDEEQPMEGELIPVGSQVAACDMDPSNYYYGYSAQMNGYVLKKKRRRRRKMLATPSDLKQLAALKGVLGQGKAFETWIATRSV